METHNSTDRPTPDTRRGLLFTAFEPSGDDHASAVVAELRARWPDLPMYAWGGRKMEAAGATLIERTGDDAVMGVPGLSKILEHRRINRRVDEWLRENPVAVHIPVDSPAANFPICAISRARGVKVVHLVAPQLWAWGPWRIRKLRRLTDLVLCLLPFEQDWFLGRGVRARFIGHPLFDRPLDEADLARRAAVIDEHFSSSPAPSPRIALMPGSRPSEVGGSWPTLLDMFRRLRADFPHASGVVAATREEVAERLRARTEALGGWPEGLAMVVGDTDAVVRWCEFAAVVSGTVTLQVARQARPMVTFYRPNRVMYQLARFLVRTQFYTLPNLIAGRRIVPELIPHFGDGEALVLEVLRLMRQPGYADDQREGLAEVASRFAGRNASRAAADAIEEVAGLRAPAGTGSVTPATASAGSAQA